MRSYILPLLLVVAVLVLLLKPSTDALPTVAQKVEEKLHVTEQSFNKDVKNKVLWNALRSKDYENEALNTYAGTSVNLSYYKNDSLLYWSGNTAFPLSPLSAIEEGTRLTKLKNGWFQLLKYSDTTSRETLLALVPVKYDYPFENNFLKNTFALDFRLPDNLQLSEQKIEGSVAVKNLSGEPMFYLYISGDVKHVEADWILLFTQLVLLLVVVYYINRAALFVIQKQNFSRGFIVLVMGVLFLRTAMLLFNEPAEFYKLELFDPRYYASSAISKSLGDLLINAALLLWIIVFYRVQSSPDRIPKYKGIVLYVFPLVVFAVTLSVWWLFKTLVLDSVISFEVYNILSLDSYSFLGLVCISILLVAHFVVSRKALRALVDAGFSFSQLLLTACVLATLFVVSVLNSPFCESLVFVSVWSAAFCMIVFLLEKSEISHARNLILVVGLYSLLSTFLIENLYERKERNQRMFFSSKLVSERDFVAEYLFEDVAKRISSDGFVKSYFNNPLISKREVTDRINSLYLGGYFERYSLQLFALDTLGHSIRYDDTTTAAKFRSLFADSTKYSTLVYLADTTQNYSYLSLVPLVEDSALLGFLCIRLSPKVYYGQNVYPELLLGNSVNVSNNPNNYSYAIYQNNKLVAQSGDFPYSYYWNKEYDFGEKEFRFIEEPDWEHGIQLFSSGKKVLVSVRREPEFEPLATFSYFFTFYFTLTGIGFLFLYLFDKNKTGQFLFTDLTLSFRTRINYSMLLMILVSFVIIGFITISFFSKQYNNFYTDRLLRKEKVVHAGLEYFIQQRTITDNFLSEDLNSELEVEVARQADINGVDINIYDRYGNLKVASQPVIYTKGLLSRKMNPVAYFDLENHRTAQVTTQENIGSLNYLASYAPVRNNAGDPIAYLGIPYFERNKNIEDEVSSFLVALMNVYVFLLICAAILAYFVSNSITRPLTIISEKLRLLNLNKTNEPIQWNSKDEIGVLVSEYNKMITELEQSAQKLAKNEREIAWREMAKQIAHEIKNPLTPMKLSIQYLQRAIDEGNPNIEQLAKKVSKTLEEQIENLSSIATAFSSFAKMPKPQNEIIELNDLLKSIVHLFVSEDVQVTFTSSVLHPLTFADKNQLVSVFNNLIKNAIQSVPENRKGFVDVHVKEEDGWVVVVVSDNGNGISQSNYEKVFVPNFTTKSSGTGLGLAITKQIIDGAGGKIWFETQENIGTSFFVKLRLNKT